MYMAVWILVQIWSRLLQWFIIKIDNLALPALGYDMLYTGDKWHTYDS